ncbi:hypothetical protein [Sphingomonas turrisvirgatae]|nr:hypothetical protein [Sphingomonas turrisvirgatae]
MGNVWDRTSEFLSDNLAAVLPIALLGIFVPLVLIDNFGALQQGATPGLRLALSIGTIVATLLMIWGSLAITALTLDRAAARSAARLALRRFPAFLLVLLVMGLALFVLIMPFGVIMAVGGVDLTTVAPDAMPAMSGGAAAMLLLYLLMLLVVGLWLMARLAVVAPAIVGERLSVAAIARSWRLTRGVALRISGVILLYVVVSSIASSAARFGVGAILKLLIGSDPGVSIATVLTSIIVAAVSTAFTVLYAVFATKLFVALLAREGGRHEAVRAQ